MKIKDICIGITDGSHNPPQGNINGTYMMLSSKNIFDDLITYEEPRWLFEEEFIKEDKRTRISTGDVLMTIVGSVGRIAVVKENERFVLQRSVAVIHPDTEKCISRYMMYSLQGKRNYIESQAKGVAQKGIYLGQVGEIEISVPDISEQYKIVEKLDKVKDIIDLRKQQLVELDNLIKSRFVEMFGDPVKNTMGWSVKRLGDLSIQINSGSTPKGGEQVYVEKGITFFRSQNVWKDRLKMEDISYIDEDTHMNMSRSSLKHGDILMTKTGRINTENSSLGRAALYMGEDDAANVNGHVYFIRLKSGINNKFILRILVSNEYRDHIRSVCVGGIDKRQLNKNHIEDFPIICPPEDMVNMYVEFVDQVTKLKFDIQKSLDETQLIFDSLMQQYFG